MTLRDLRNADHFQFRSKPRAGIKRTANINFGVRVCELRQKCSSELDYVTRRSEKTGFPKPKKKKEKDSTIH